jgi:2-oxoglutarate dehydrogenase E2 component (dihydrolipoamide succinyltransferase)
MSTHVKVPAVGESISSGVLSTWHFTEGANVSIGDLLFTLETDKISTEVTATEAGLLKRLVAEGAEVKIGEVVAEIIPASTENQNTAEKTLPQKEELQIKKEKNPQATITAIKPQEFQDSSISEKISEPMEAKSRLEGDVTRRKLTPLRRKIAAQLVSAQQTAAILTTFNEVDMSSIMHLRKEIQESFQKKHGVKLGLMSFFIKAVVQALQAVPSINARLDEEELVENHYYDIGVAVGTQKGLLVPVLRHCERESLARLEEQLLNYAQKAREGKITLADLQGGVFTISNGGVYGSLLSTPILNPPQSGILGMHTIQERPVVVNGQIVIRPMMYLALSYDHRLVDGKEAVTFLIKVKEVVENPLHLFLE